MPPTAGKTVRPRRPELRMNAQSGPGTMISSRATTQKATTELAAMEGSPSNSATEGKLSPIGRKVFPSSVAVRAICGRVFRVDALDRKILAALQEDGRLTVTE